MCSGFCLQAADRPNIVWLVSEDNSVHYLKHFDEHGAPTPRIEALAAHGLTFDHAFSNAPVCSVARTTLATGCYGPRIGTQYHRRSVSVPLPDGMKMFPEYLRGAGYYTANNNKTDYNAIPGKNVWDESSRKASWRKRKDGQPFFYAKLSGMPRKLAALFRKGHGDRKDKDGPGQRVRGAVPSGHADISLYECPVP
jgi:uncharacterized sulfatase